jgi:amidase
MSIVEKSAVQLRQLIRDRKLSPVELLDACIARIETINPSINAIAGKDFERARSLAKVAETKLMDGSPLPLLHGLPLGVKDLQETAGLLTTYGNITYRNHVPTFDNSQVARLRQAGAIVTAKTNTPDMGAGANTRNAVWGATGNPFNPHLNAGGSSGGSAAALATDMLPICTGSDTGGSLRIPSALCGVVGLRPTPGRVADNTRTLGWSVLNVLGPMGRNVEDTALLMAASLGAHDEDPLSYATPPENYWPLPAVDLSKLRIGYTEDFGSCIVDQDIRRVFRNRIEKIRPNVLICEPLNFDLMSAGRTFDVLRAENFLAAFSSLDDASLNRLGENLRSNLNIASAISLKDRASAHLDQTRIMRQFNKIFNDYDLILSPTSPVSPFPWEKMYADVVDGQVMKNYYQWAELTYMVTLATNPALSMPCGKDEYGMPFGLQVIGKLREDHRLLASANALELFFKQDINLARPIPDLTLLREPYSGLKSIVTHPPGSGCD